MLIEVMINNFLYDGERKNKHDIVDVDEGTAMRMLKFGLGRETKNKTITNEKREVNTKKAIRKSTKTNV